MQQQPMQQQLGGSFKQPAFMDKSKDPLIMAETNKKVEEQRQLIEADFKNQMEDMQRKFELKKQEILQQNKEECKKVAKMWETKKAKEENRIREQAEEQADQSLQEYKVQLKKEEDAEMK
jgi:hypothetical protein